MILAVRSFYLMGVICLLAFIAAIEPRWQDLWQVALTGFAVFLLIDLLLLWRESPPEIEREIAASLSLGIESKAALKVRNRGGRNRYIRIYDHYPDTMQTEDFPQQALIARHQWKSFHYRLVATKRGPFVFDKPQLRYLSVLGLWWRDVRVGKAQTVHVYPDFAAVTKYILLASMDRIQQMGIRKRRRRGEGSEFHQLREFRQGDALRQVDWRATARHRKLISREYQDERDQNIIMLLDCGRRMRTYDETAHDSSVSLSHFDHALNAMLLLSYVALRQGDAIGFGTFSGEERWLKPVRGIGMINTLLNLLYDVQPSTLSPDYSRAAMNLLARQRKRSLVIVLTNLRDEDSDDLLPALKLLKTRHMVLLASLREKAIDDVLYRYREISDFNEALTLASVHQYLNERQQAIQWLQNHHINTLDVPPQGLSVSLVNTYLQLKAANAI